MMKLNRKACAKRAINCENEYEQIIQELREICRKRKFALHCLGKSAGKKSTHFPLYSVIVNNAKNNKCKSICFCAGIHGNEIAGPYAVIKLMRDFDFSRYKNLKIIFFPIANPYGFIKKIRRNGMNCDINRHFCEKNLKHENRLLYDAIKKEDILFFHSLHEDLDRHNFYIYAFEKSGKEQDREQKEYERIIKIAKKHFQVDAGASIYQDKANHGIIINEHDGSFEDRMFKEGVPYSICTETSGKLKLKRRIMLDLELMRSIIRFSNKEAERF